MDNNLIQEGDIFILEEGDNVYAIIPQRLFISNRPYCWDLERTDTVIGKYYHSGRYLAVKCLYKGGGTGHGPHDVYPDGWNVEAVKVADEKMTGSCDEGDIINSEKVSFYQSGCFTAKITRNIHIIGKATKKWSVS